MATLNQQIRELQKEADLLRGLRADAKTDGGRLTQFGKDVLHACVNSDMPNAEIARLLDISPAAVKQNKDRLSNK